MQRSFTKPFASVAVLLALAACGGGGADPQPSSGAAGLLAAAPAAQAASDPAADDGADAQAADAVADAEALAAADAQAIAAAAASAAGGADNRAGRLAAAARRPTDPSTPVTPGADVAAAGATDSQRIAAATATAQTNPACTAIRPFYWEIGTKTGKSASGTLASPGTPTKYSATMPMSVASASKWIYGSYVAQRQGTALNAADRKHLSMRSGYTKLVTCEPSGTVDSCLAYQGNGTYVAEDEGRFHYDGGHMEKHASLIGLGAMDNAALANAMRVQLGSDVSLRFSQPQLAGGLVMSPDAYAKVLRKMMSGQLKLGALLGSEAVCTNPLTCGFDEATFPPIPTTESWHYSLAHWVEDDPVVGDGSFSSPGVFGFYPWIDASRTLYGIVARMQPNGGFESVQCGRLIRKAWKTAAAQ